MVNYILLDTETTGADEKDRIIQLGFMVLSNSGAIEVHNEFCFTEVPIAIGAMETHHITPEMIEDKPACIETQAYKRLLELNIADNYLIMHNAPFDMGMLKKEGFENRTKVIDTLRVAKHVFDDEDAHRLQYFRYAFGLYKEEQQEAKKLNIEIKAHDAIGDVLTLKLFLSRLKQRIQERFPEDNPVEKMVFLTSQPVKVKKLHFGKYRGELIEDIAQKDRSYLEWLLNNTECNEDLKYTLNTFLT